jgi:hypothetical protein
VRTFFTAIKDFGALADRTLVAALDIKQSAGQQPVTAEFDNSTQPLLL